MAKSVFFDSFCWCRLHNHSTSKADKHHRMEKNQLVSFGFFDIAAANNQTELFSKFQTLSVLFTNDIAKPQNSRRKIGRT